MFRVIFCYGTCFFCGDISVSFPIILLKLVLRSEIRSVMCAELRTVAASNNRDHPTRSLLWSPLASTINCSPGSPASLEVTHQDHSSGITLLLFLRATYIMVLFFTHIPFVVNHTINATPPERLQQLFNDNCSEVVPSTFHYITTLKQ